MARQQLSLPIEFGMLSNSRPRPRLKLGVDFVLPLQQQKQEQEQELPTKFTRRMLTAGLKFSM